MFELNAKQEMALSIVWMRQDQLPLDFDRFGNYKASRGAS